MTEDAPELEIPRRVAIASLAAVAIAVVAASWTYLTNGQAPYGDDNSAHLALMMHIADLWRAGVTDLWWDQSNLGLPLFLAYQPLPALLTGTTASFFAETSARILLFKASIVGLWALMPAAWYLGARWLGLDRLTALVFGLLTLATHDLHDVGFTFRSVTYGGLYTQVWGMFFFPMTVGAFRRYVIDEDIRLVVPVGLFVVLSMSHLFCGMFAGIACVVWVVFSGGRYVERAGRAAAVFLPALLLMAFWLGPLLAHRDLIGGLPWKNEYFNGWPADELFSRIMGGEVFDDGRIPWLTALAGVGIVSVAQRASKPFERWLLGLSGISVLLFMGRTSFGELYDVIPMHAHINVMRYINAIQFCGLLFAAIAFVSIARWLAGRLEHSLDARRARLLVAVLAALLLAGYSVARATAFEDTLNTFDHRQPHVAALLDDLEQRPDQRLAVSEELNTSPHFYRDLLPALAGRGQLQSYALGYHATLSTYYADYLNYNATWCRLFNVGDLVARRPHREQLVRGLDNAFEEGPFVVWRPPDANWSYFDFVHTPLDVHGDYHAIRPAVRRILQPGFSRRTLPVLSGPTQRSERAEAPVIVASDASATWHSRESLSRWVDIIASSAPTEPISSRVLSVRRGPNWYATDVDATGESRLMLKVNYFPYWRATVDGEPVEIDHIAPNFMAIDVPRGGHEVRFVYENPWWQKAGLLLTLLVLVGWLIASGWHRGRRRLESAPPDAH